MYGVEGSTFGADWLAAGWPDEEDAPPPNANDMAVAFKIVKSNRGINFTGRIKSKRHECSTHALANSADATLRLADAERVLARRPDERNQISLAQTSTSKQRGTMTKRIS